MTMPGCPPPQSLEELARLAPGDPRREHLEECPRCHARWTALRSFLSGQPVPPGARLDEAKSRLVRALRDEVVGAQMRRAPTARHPFGGGLRWSAWRPAIGLAAAGVVILVGLRLLESRPEPPSVLLRGESEVSTVSLAPVAVPISQGAMELRWRACPGSDAYQVILFRPGLEEFARLDAGRDTCLALSPERLAKLGPPGSAVFWRVAALHGGDPLSLSSPATLRLP